MLCQRYVDMRAYLVLIGVCRVGVQCHDLIKFSCVCTDPV